MQTATHAATLPEDQFVSGSVLHSDLGGEGVFAVRRTRILHPNADLHIRYGGTDSHLARLNLCPTPFAHQVVGGKTVALPPRMIMDTALRYVDEEILWPAAHRLDQITFDLPRPALKRWAEGADLRNFGGLEYQPGMVTTDETIQAFGIALLQCLKAPQRAPTLFVDHILNGMCSYLVERFGGRTRALRRGGLAPWQERRAKEMMDAQFDGDLPLKMLAEECGLSVAHFSRAFRQSTGQTPHKWLVKRRIDHAMSLLSETDLSLAQISMRCGFSDQSHFTNVFSKSVGTSPGASRRFWTSRAPSLNS